MCAGPVMLLLGLLGLVTSQSKAPLYPKYGFSSPTSDDGSSPLITLEQGFVYFGRTYHQVYVNQNGHLTFEIPWGRYIPLKFPMHGPKDIIAPFWTDLDNRQKGKVTYKQHISGSVLEQATRDINEYFPYLQQSPFEATWVFVATWDGVQYYPYKGDGSTFQVVLISGGNMSFVLMNYETIESIDLLNTTHSVQNVQAGYDTIQSAQYFSIPGSFAANATGPNSSFCLSSNVNKKGRWAFRIDQETNNKTRGAPMTFWKDSNCNEKCTYSSTGLSCHRESCAFSQVCVPVDEGLFTCQSVQKGTCTISGDPHYNTFDGNWHHFQGTCTYVLSQQCGSDLPYYRVEGSNEHRGSTHVSWTRLVKVLVYNETIELVKGHPGQAKVNGVFKDTPFSLNNGAVHVHVSGFSVVVSTDFGLEVSYDTNHYVKIQVPPSYQGETCGLCGNFNNDPDDDFQTPQGEVVSAGVFGKSWIVPKDDEFECDGCEGSDCGECTEEERAVFSQVNRCGILQDTTGPFASCHQELSPQHFVENCVFDMCLDGGQQHILCQALTSYSTQCQDKGIELPSWRRPDLCEIVCPDNSHFDSQGAGCPVTCVNHDSRHDCALPSRESCSCDEGFVLSGAKCVPPQECGCNHEGYYYHSGQTVILDQDCGRVCYCSSGNMTCQSHGCGPHQVCKVNDGERGCYNETCAFAGEHILQGVSFWTDSTCTQKCTCTTSGLSCLRESCASSQVCVPFYEDLFTCQTVQKGTCTISGDPHYNTFDGNWHHFQGTCTYVLSQQCGSDLPYYRVEGSNEHRGSTRVSWTRLVKVLVYNETIELVKGHPGQAKVNGVFKDTPFSLNNGAVHVHVSGFSVVVSTDFGLEVSYDTNHYVKIQVPPSYQGATCGLCGNFNNDPDDDFQTPQGEVVSAGVFGKSWIVPKDDEFECDGCDGSDCGECTEEERAVFSQVNRCGILQDTTGPFASCHQELSPQRFVENCVFDMCLDGGQQHILCQALTSYSTQCQDKGIELPNWRRPDLCEIVCPDNSHFDSQGAGCPVTCVNHDSRHDCALPSRESCSCDEGFVLSGAKCVPPQECGCNHEGYYYHSGQTVILDQDCGRVCYCSSGNMTCQSHGCGPHQVCKVNDGERGCYNETCAFGGEHILQGVSFWTDSTCTQKCTCTTSGLSCLRESCASSQVCVPFYEDLFTCQTVQKGTCTISGDPHYNTFDGNWHHFQGTCTYVLSQQCGSDLPYYRVEGSNEHRGSTRVSWTRLVKVLVYNETIELVKGHPGQAKVNGVFKDTPFSLNNGAVHVHVSGFSVVVSTDFGLEVSYDTNHYVKIQVPPSYQGATCGLCGNFNNDPDDDFQTPQGEVVSAGVFGKSWIVPKDDEFECDGCEGSDCGECTEEERAVFSQVNRCGILQDTTGPFASCHQELSPQRFVENCVFDMCLDGGQQHILCQALTSYSTQCQDKGIELPNWRRPDLCEIVCPDNSHFDSQGAGCPVTCVNHDSRHDCALPSRESCSCDEGFVLSGAKCVPPQECGCNHEGYYYHSGQTVILDQDCGRVCYCSSGNMTCQSHGCGPHQVCKVNDGERGCYNETCAFGGEHILQGVSFWTDSTCTQKCTCTTSGLSCLRESCASSQVCVPFYEDLFTCQTVQKGTCTISGDPHYNTFDGNWHHFQGTCTYVLSQQCGSDLPYYRVEGSNEHRGSTRVSWTRLVKVLVYNETIELVKGHPGQAKVNGVFKDTPFSLNNGAVHVHVSGFSVVVSTDFGLEVSYDTNHYVKIQVPPSYQGATCGLCGNFNNDPDDDFQTPQGEVVSAGVFGKSWIVPKDDEFECDGCEGSDCGECTEEERAVFSPVNRCGILQDTTGPFASCHQELSPQRFVENCVFDMCLDGGQQHILCQALTSYSTQCQDKGIELPNWRRPDLCEIVCPDNSHFDSQGAGCPVTCVNHDSRHDCALPSRESCSCDEGFVLSGAKCVPPQECGCNHEGYYYHSGQTVILDQDCGRVCYCSSGNMTCQSHGCGPHQVCKVNDGERGCYNETCAFGGEHILQGVSFWTDSTCTQKCTCTTSGLSCLRESCASSQVCVPFYEDLFTCQTVQKGTCTISGDPHYNTFDGNWHHFQGTCTYVLSQQCGSDLPYYRVEGSNEHRGSTRVSWTRLVKVLVYNETIELVKGHPGQAKVNGVFKDTPFSLNNGAVHVHVSGFSVVVSTDFGLEVSYDTNHYVKIQVPPSYQGATCGLCGNFNNDPDDDFQTPQGEVVSAGVFGKSWIVPKDDEFECDGCEGSDCGECTEEERAVFSQVNRCGILQDTTGPFASCHQELSPQRFVENCVFDMCLDGGQQHILCQALTSYSTQCQDKGIELPNWRRPDLCEIVCPDNSHFDSQGAGCPVTCVNHDSRHDCALPSRESCSCDEGFVLSGAKCVPPQECGCNHEGYYYDSGQTVILDQDCGRVCYCSSGNMTCQSHGCGPHQVCKVNDGERGCYNETCAFGGEHILQGVSFWTDSTCTQKCTCTTSGLSCLRESCASSQVCVPFYEDLFTCQTVQKGTCTISGDPHYNTFDGNWHHFQGTCTYVLSQQCGSDLPYYRVEGSNEHRGSTRVSWTRLVKVLVYNETIELVKGHPGQAKVNGVFKDTPFSLNNGAVHVHVSGFSVVVSTDFGLEVSYDTNHYVKIQVPPSYQGATCGLCGNFNNDPDDDFQTPQGEVVSAGVFGKSWIVPKDDEFECDGCEGSDCGECTEEERAVFSQVNRCGILQDTTGPFASCHQELSPQRFVENCVFDMCLDGGQQHILCQALTSYSTQCQDKGIELPNWRRPDLCEIVCPDNSHFDSQGAGCPVTCVNHDSRHDCALPSRESCSCDEGFVLSGAKCVPPQECGCNHEGYYYHSGQTVKLDQDCGRVCYCSSGNMTCQSHGCGPHQVCKVNDGERGCYNETCAFGGEHILQGVSFWTDSTCTQKCTCTTSGLSCLRESCASSQVCVPFYEDLFTCQTVQKGTCTISGDPHYNTFDGNWHHFQGTCTYVLSQQCGSDLPYYRVEGSNEHRGSTRVSWTRLVKVLVYNETIELVKGHPGQAKVNGVFKDTPFSLNNGAVHVHVSGFSVVVSTDFGLEVSYDTNHYVKIQVPPSYQGATCGLCGNFNNDPDDDFQTPQGEVVSAGVFGKSWIVPKDDEFECDGCEGSDCGECTEEERAVFSQVNRCGILQDTTGPFASCHQELSPQRFVENCVFDMCLDGGQQHILCQALTSYSTQCQDKGIELPNWRRPDLCEIVCPDNSHFDSQGAGCPVTCVNHDSRHDCALPSRESCSCDEGFVLSGAKCVPPQECGCNHEGYYYHSGQTVILDQDCGRVCYCSSGNMTCQSHGCGPHQVCKVNDGERGCYNETCSFGGEHILQGVSFWTDSTCTQKCTCTTSGLSCLRESCASSQVCVPFYEDLFTCQTVQKGTCTISGDPHYNTFDGNWHHFQGTCTYVLSQQCGSDLPYYRVEGSNEHRGSTRVSWTRLVKVLVYNETIELVKGHPGQAKVNGVFKDTPFSLNNGAVHVHVSGFSVVVSTDFGLEVSYDTNHYVKIQVPPSYQGATCGLCGNFNNDPDDDFQTPQGEVVSAGVFGKSWIVPKDDEFECDGCEGSDCGECTEEERAVFSQVNRCGILQDTTGPFASCHQELSPQRFVENCVFDMCLDGGQQHILCQALTSYSTQCQDKGIELPNWRRPDLCEIVCPDNSHFDSQGAGCPVTCVNHDSRHDCALPSRESCSCDEGFVLSGAKCVPPQECGCNHEGYYYHSGQTVILDQDCGRVCYCSSGNMTCQSHGCGPHQVCKVNDGERGCYNETCAFGGEHILQGVSFWTDSTCTQKCTCTTSGLSCLRESCASSQVCVPFYEDLFTCQTVQKGTCTISGDPHYNTFDGNWHHFQGTCTYVLSQQCGSDLPYYRVEGSNEHRGSTRVSWTRLVKVLVYNETIELVKGHPGQAKVNGVFKDTPFSLNNGAVHVHVSGFSVVVSTDFGLEVSYDTNHYVKIQVPPSYQGATCGLCGNFNNDPDDDFQTPQGEVVSAGVFGKSWIVPKDDEFECDGCEGSDCGECTEEERAVFSQVNRCGILQDTTGPFASCHQELSPQRFVENCVFDMCLDGGQQHILCQALTSYSTQCQDKGIELPNWRRPDLCEIVCPDNSHFDSQGAGCPVTCVNHDSRHDCALPSRESCSCDEGFVLSGAKCVPPQECGCNHEGYYYHSGQTVILDQDCGRVCYCSSGNMTCQSHGCGPHQVCKVNDGERGCYNETCAFGGEHILQGVSFWTDSTCTQKCTCTTSGLSCLRESCASSQVCVPVDEDLFTCQTVQKGTCTISGDPHYNTFDGNWHHFQGTCTYVLSQQCGSDLPYYRVEGSNEHRGSTRVSWTRLVKVLVYNETIELVKGHPGQAKVNGVFKDTPFSLNNGAVHVHVSGFSVVVSTDFGLEVSYDTNHYVKIQVPPSYQGATCGLCGNFNNDPDDDFQTPQGEVVSAGVFGKSWIVPKDDEFECDGCEGSDCGECTEEERAVFSQVNRCGILQDTTGPFASCHQELSPQRFVENCVFDMCLDGGQQHILCQALTSYSTQCQDKGIELPNWRRPDLCEIVCPDNSHFDSQGAGCPVTCVNHDSRHDCALPSRESCSCDEGFVLSGAKCVPPQECGCNHEGYYYHSGQTVILDQDCGRVCYCSSGNMTCQSHGCGPHQVCKVNDGERGCYNETCAFGGEHILQGVSFWTDSTCTQKCTCTTSGLSCLRESCASSQVCVPFYEDLFTCQTVQKGTCTISGDPHYNTFDGNWHHFQGTCTYVLSQQCGSDLPYYRVEGSNEHRGSTRVSWTRLVKVLVYNETIELVKGHPGQAKVNGVFKDTPFSLNNGTVHVHVSGFSVVVSTDFGLEVSYDTNHYVKIQVPPSYQGATCGLCGNFNNDPDDDFQTPQGEVVSAGVFGKSWIVPKDDEFECDGCEGSDCGECTEEERAVFSQVNRCGILQDTTGPFASCHQELSPQRFVENCVFDMCLDGGQQHILCQALTSYSTQCQDKGIELPNWRRPDLCEIVCPDNSHFDSQGAGCPVTCVNHDSRHDCALPSRESCSCDEGFVLSGAKCVPPQECGCNHEGYYYHSGQTVILDQDCGRVCYCSSGNMTCQSYGCGPHQVCKVNDGERGCYNETCAFAGEHILQGMSFWTDSTCTQKCTCTTSGLSCLRESCASSQVCVPFYEDLFTCQTVQKGTCTISGDPHYNTFDGNWHHFQGTCTYVLSQQCGSDLPYYRVEGSNEHRGSARVSWTRLVKVLVYNETIELVKGHPGQAKVNCVFKDTPFSLNNGTVHVHVSGFSVVVSTDFGLEVSYDTNHYVKIQVPPSYQGATCGLCGNFNNDPDDDFQTPQGEVVSAGVFGKSWIVPKDDEFECDGCEGSDCGECTEEERAVFSQVNRCGILQDTTGPFASCHQELSPQRFVENCVFDMCLDGGQQHILCQALTSYSTQCQDKGIELPNWRRPDLCEIVCPDNSHFDSQGAGCPVTCVNHDSRHDCALPSRESCSCDEGFVLSGAKCVPPQECGCNHEGYYYHSGQTVILDQDCGRVCYCSSGNMTCQSHGCGPHQVCKVNDGERGCYNETCAFGGEHILQGVSFWTDSTCTQKCTCTTSGLSCLRESCASSQVCVPFYEDLFTCQTVQKGTCTISGDPHYNTFDGNWHHFQGTCTYVLSQQCGSDLPYYRVEGSNEHRGSTRVSWTRLVKVLVYNETIELVKGHPGQAKVNGVFKDTPFSLNNGTVHVHVSGFSVVVSTDFGLEVSYDTNHYVKIQVPPSYQGATCGLCGNFNNDPDDDFQTPQGEVVSAGVFGKSWIVPKDDEFECDGCEGSDCGECTEEERAVFSQVNRCGILQDTTGPFASCHQELSPQRFVENCVFDMCLDGGQQHILCQALTSYSTQCQDKGIELPNWRRPDLCEIVCPDNSHFDSQGAGCPVTCVNHDSRHDCALPSRESCSCDEGFVLSGAKCVPPQECGCNHEGYYYHSGQTVILDQDCGRVCYCSSGNMTCQSHGCGPHQVCKVNDGERGCYNETCAFGGEHILQGVSFWTDSTCTQKCTCTTSGLSCLRESCASSQVCVPVDEDLFTCQTVQKGTCTISGDPHYNTFDGNWHHFQGTCTYVLSQQCGSDLPYYRVEGSNEHRGSTRVSWTRLVKVLVYNETIELVKGHPGQAKVNCVFKDTPFSLNNGTVHVHVSGFSVVVSTDFGLEVSYDTNHYVKIQVPPSYQGATCGLCGNFNNDPDDDFQTPQGEVVSAGVFGKSWIVPKDDEFECDGCEGSDCGECTEEERAVFSQVNRCGILQDTTGPFASCHQELSPQRFVENCVFDMCLDGGQQHILCQALTSYSTQCQDKGIELPNWRRPDLCEIVCPDNSHFDSQGAGCPVTCVNHDSRHDCALPSRESCSCDEGFVLSGAKCVPPQECGCNHEGYYYHSGQTVILDQDCGRVCYCSSGNMTCQSHGCGPHQVCKVNDGERGCYNETCAFGGEHILQGVSFWTDSTCTQKCTCTTSGLSCLRESCASSQVCVPVDEDLFTCQTVQKGTCTISGDPHYNTFDGNWHHFQGTCTYVLSQQCGSDLPYYRVEGSNEHRGSTHVSWTRQVKVLVYNETIELVKGHPGQAKVNGVFKDTPFSLNNGTVHVHVSGFSVVVSTDFGLEVSYDTNHYVKIQVPPSYQGATCGLCGNFNNDPDDDFQTPQGEVVSAGVFGKSWIVPKDDEFECDGCEGSDCGECTEEERAVFSQVNRCGILQDTTGPFASCHQELSPQRFVENCVFDMCLDGGQQHILCQALTSYSTQCQDKGIELPNWRRPDLCEIVCPDNSHFDSQGAGCPVTCVNHDSRHDCVLPSRESCSCDEGFVLSGAKCVPPQECGCNHEGYYYHSGQTVILDQDCGRVCYCSSGNMTCQSHGCGPHQVCEVYYGERVCRPVSLNGTCSGSGDPHYLTFDGKPYDFQGACRYILVTLCDYTIGLNNFSIEAKNEPWKGLPVSVTAEVFVHVWGFEILMTKERHGEVMVNGIWMNLPVQVLGRALRIYTSGHQTVFETDFGVHVSYDGVSRVSVSVPSNYSGKTCGLCGNFNGNPDDDFQTPSGQNVMSPSDFGTSWKVPGDNSCGDGCGSSCPRCLDDRVARAQCEIINAAMGPFSLCHQHVDPRSYFNDCVFDVCIGGSEMLCFAIQAYVSFCQSANVRINPWRHNTSCHMVCPAHSHYELCGADCGRTCASTTDVTCDRVCSEGCFCDEGFMRSGTKCVPEEKCGCQHDGFYYNAGELFWTEGCSQRCECTAPNSLNCMNTTCSPHQECTIRDGQLGCFETIDPCGELKCTDNEWCKQKEGIYGCFCKENAIHDLDNFDASITCAGSAGTASLSRCQLTEAGFHPSGLHLRDNSCRGSLKNGRLVFNFNNEDQLCGTVLKSNGTHFLYENVILGEDSIKLTLLFSCAFPLTSALSMNVAINPVESAIKKVLPTGRGHYRMRLTPYRDAGFQHPLNNSTDIELRQDEHLFIEVQAEGVDDRQTSTVMDTCWATPVNDARYPLRQDLISQGCPAEESVKIIQNGNSTVARFSFEAFSINDFPSIFLHCNIHLCLLDFNNCAVQCNVHTRGRRDVSYHDTVMLSLGPLAPKEQAD